MPQLMEVGNEFISVLIFNFTLIKLKIQLTSLSVICFLKVVSGFLTKQIFMVKTTSVHFYIIRPLECIVIINSFYFLHLL